MGIKVLIVDDHAILRRGLRQIVSEAGDIEVVGEASNSAEAMRFVRDSECEVVLLDITMPDRNGIETLQCGQSIGIIQHSRDLSRHQGAVGR